MDKTDERSISSPSPTLPKGEGALETTSTKSSSFGEGTEKVAPLFSPPLGELEGAVIVGGGDFPTHPIPLQLMNEAEHVVCCDGAANEFLARGLRPWRVVGDCDSLSPEAAQAFKEIVRHNPDQETNDQTKAVQFLLAQGKKHIAIVGATGKREDHTIGNISLLMEYMRMGVDVCMYTDYGVFIPCKDVSVCKCSIGQQISIFNFSAHNMKSKGLAYPIYDFTTWWQGTLNKSTDTSFTIEAEGEYLVFLNY